MWQHIFWFFGHPEVYILILPAMGLVSDIISCRSRKPIFGYHSMVLALVSIAFLGWIVWGHHMFQSGMNPLLGMTFVVTTVVIAVPSAIKVFNWMGTLWRGNIHFDTPLLHAVSFVSLFIIGGLSGIFMASAPVDIYIHDTYFIVAHLHYVLVGGTLFGIFAGITFWFPKLFGRMMHEGLGKVHWVLSFIFYNLTFFPMHNLGVQGMMRRIYDPNQYEFLQALQPMNTFITINMFIFASAQAIFAFNFRGACSRVRRPATTPGSAIRSSGPFRLLRPTETSRRSPSCTAGRTSTATPTGRRTSIRKTCRHPRATSEDRAFKRPPLNPFPETDL